MWSSCGMCFQQPKTNSSYRKDLRAACSWAALIVISVLAISLAARNSLHSRWRNSIIRQMPHTAYAMSTARVITARSRICFCIRREGGRLRHHKSCCVLSSDVLFYGSIVCAKKWLRRALPQLLKDCPHKKCLMSNPHVPVVALCKCTTSNSLSRPAVRQMSCTPAL
jgi:hypothetical protein